MNLENYVRSDKGQSVFEVLIAVAIATLIVGSAVTATIVSLRSGVGATNSQKAYAIAGETLNNVRSIAESNWADLYAGRDGTTQYRLAVVSTSTTSTILGVATGTEVVSFTSTSTGENINYTRWFIIDDVQRDVYNWIGVGQADPTTLQLTAYVSWALNDTTNTIDLATYVSKIRTRSVGFDSWSGSSGVTTPVTGPTTDYYSSTGTTINASGDITLP